MAHIQSHRSTFYHRLVHCYEWFFAGFFRERIRSTIKSLDIAPGAKILEVGVGTGSSLPAYPPHADVTGIDLSEEMLNLARKKLEELGRTNINLQVGDALSLDFPDGTFDYVMAFHVVSVVPDHERLLREMVRVAKPDGTLIIINHFKSERPWISTPMTWLDPLTRHLGWRVTLRYDDVVCSQPLRVEDRYKTSPQSLFTVVKARKQAS
ncbi:MAG: methyltransferase domain-containing protein [Planctomycetales bacterium]|nr:methyltransferase domain-containing protein [Planctomycetales bacterium]